MPPSEDIAPYSADDLLEWPRDQLDQLDLRRLDRTSSLLVGRFLDRLTVDERRTVLRRLPLEDASDVLSEMDSEEAAEVVGAMREKRALEVLSELDPDDAADVVGELDAPDQQRLLDKLEPGHRAALQSLLSYEPESVGGIMTTEVPVVRAKATIDEAIEAVRAMRENIEYGHYLYITNADDRLVGVLSLRELLLGRKGQSVGEIMEKDLVGVLNPQMDREEAALQMAEHNLATLPVTDGEGKLIGVITHDDVLDILQQEATEDMQIMVGAGGDESVHDRVTYSLKKRLPWLLVNLLTAFAAALVVSLFEGAIEKLALLAVFMPVVAGLGGNTGQQTLAVAIRSLALGELGTRDGKRVLGLEAAKAAVNGFVVGVLSGGIAYAFKPGDWLFCGVVFVSMFLTMLLAGVSGALIPLFLKKFGLDPAQSASIFLTAVIDVGGFLIFLSLGAGLLL